MTETQRLIASVEQIREYIHVCLADLDAVVAALEKSEGDVFTVLGVDRHDKGIEAAQRVIDRYGRMCVKDEDYYLAAEALEVNTAS